MPRQGRRSGGLLVGPFPGGLAVGSRSAAARPGRGCRKRRESTTSSAPTGPAAGMGSTRAAGPREDRRDERADCDGLARTDAGVDSFAVAAARRAPAGRRAGGSGVVSRARPTRARRGGARGRAGRLHAARCSAAARRVWWRRPRAGGGRRRGLGGVLAGRRDRELPPRDCSHERDRRCGGGHARSDGAAAAIVWWIRTRSRSPRCSPSSRTTGPGCRSSEGLPARRWPRDGHAHADDEVVRRGAVGVAVSSVDVRCASRRARDRSGPRWRSRRPRGT